MKKRRESRSFYVIDFLESYATSGDVNLKEKIVRGIYRQRRKEGVACLCGIRLLTFKSHRPSPD